VRARAEHQRDQRCDERRPDLARLGANGGTSAALLQVPLDTPSIAPVSVTARGPGGGGEVERSSAARRVRRRRQRAARVRLRQLVSRLRSHPVDRVLGDAEDPADLPGRGVVELGVPQHGL
jgi:hypothetical protein